MEKFNQFGDLGLFGAFWGAKIFFYQPSFFYKWPDSLDFFLAVGSKSTDFNISRQQMLNGNGETGPEVPKSTPNRADTGTFRPVPPSGQLLRALGLRPRFGRFFKYSRTSRTFTCIERRSHAKERPRNARINPL